jgi:DNA (cytosine-5)-methyltransferase 1
VSRIRRVRRVAHTRKGRLNELALFLGGGGGVLASRLLGWRTVCAVEVDPYRREVVLRRQEEGYLEPFPIWDDARTFDGRPWRGAVDVVSGGFPCQPFSFAGRRAGADDARNLWPDTIRIIREVEPGVAFLENVPGLLSPVQDKETGETLPSYFGTILGDLAESGYDVRWRLLSAAELGAPHLRFRLWIMAYTDGFDWSLCVPAELSQDALPQAGRRGGAVGSSLPRWPPLVRDELGWDEVSEVAEQPVLPGVADGVPYRMDRLITSGQAQVPAVARAAWELLTDDLRRDALARRSGEAGARSRPRGSRAAPRRSRGSGSSS